MFVANLAPVLIVCSAALVRGSGEHLTAAEITQILQCAMFAAGIGTCMQLYPIWTIASKLPIVMGVSFTFLGSLLIICTNPELGYEGMIGAVILGGCTVMMFGSIIADFSINHKYDKTPQDFSQSVLLQKQSPRGRSSRAFV